MPAGKDRIFARSFEIPKTRIQTGDGVASGLVLPGFDGFAWDAKVMHSLDPFAPVAVELAASVVGAYGTTQTDFVTLPNGTQWDSLEITLTVQQGTPFPDPNFHNWGSFTGSWHATRGAEVSVPDSAPTVLLLTLTLGLLGVARFIPGLTRCAV